MDRDRNFLSKSLILLLFIVSLGVLFFAFFYTNFLISFSSEALETTIKWRLTTASKRAVNLVTTEELDLYRTPEDMALPSYQALRLKLFDFAQKTGVLYMYYLRSQDNQVQFIVDNDFDGEIRGSLETPSIPVKETPWIREALEGRTGYSGLGNYTPGWEGLLTSLSPVFDQDGKISALVGVDIEDTSLVRAERMVRIMTVIQIIAMAVVIISGCICFIRFRREAERAKEANIEKTAFLSHISHAIRTPMNAIIGMSELILHCKPEDAGGRHEWWRGNVFEIKHAGAVLLALINDILDFSKIEAGNMELHPAPYSLVSLLDSVIERSRGRLAGKPILFMVDAGANLPGKLSGDEARVRQILVNLLSNAAKYTPQGSIRLTVKAEPSREDAVVLSLEVSDTGIGIKKEAIPNLFDGFVYSGEGGKERRGTGLGLAITRNLCRAMGGDIRVESECGKGSVFTASIPQGRVDDEKFAVVEDAPSKAVLLWDHRPVYAEALRKTLEDLGAAVTTAAGAEEFRSRLAGSYSHAFVSALLADEAERFLGRRSPRPLLVLLEDYRPQNPPAGPVLLMPAYSVSIAGLLNGQAWSHQEETGICSFTAKETRLLVVDDISTNLKIAEGLLSPYRCRIDTCSSGAEAVELAKKNVYDIIFMDHLMPGMDGFEAVRFIRASEKNAAASPAPIIALTANAVSGVEDRFLKNGFNDCLSKPIDVAKLDEIMEKWVPGLKKGSKGASDPVLDAWDTRSGESAILTIPGLDVRRGIAMTGGTVEGYRQVLAVFLKDTQERLVLLRNFMEAPENEDRLLFVTQVHALKSASASVGADELSALAERLEVAGRLGDLAYLAEELPDFTERLAELAEDIRAALKDSLDPSEGSEEELPPRLLRELAAALAAEKVNDIERIMDELRERSMGQKARDMIEQISDLVLVAEFDKAKKILGQ